jgi:hypothetical protein
MTINYATAAAGGSQQRTGTQLRLAGYGPRAANVVGLTDQTDLFCAIADALKLPQTPAELSRNARVQVAPRTVTPGATVAINGWSFYGDDTVSIELRSGSTIRAPGRPEGVGRPVRRITDRSVHDRQLDGDGDRRRVRKGSQQRASGPMRTRRRSDDAPMRQGTGIRHRRAGSQCRHGSGFATSSIRSRSRTQKPWWAHSSSRTTCKHSSTDFPSA